jgi:putative membrane protein insertion efficiency factor
MIRTAEKIISYLLSLPVYFYKFAISPLLRTSCRHVPSCSQFAIDALKIHGPVRGSLLAVNRILRCRPGGTHGYDPVPRFWIRRYYSSSLLLKRYPKENRLKR